MTWRSAPATTRTRNGDHQVRASQTPESFLSVTNIARKAIGNSSVIQTALITMKSTDRIARLSPDHRGEVRVVLERAEGGIRLHLLGLPAAGELAAALG